MVLKNKRYVLTIEKRGIFEKKVNSFAPKPP